MIVKHRAREAPGALTLRGSPRSAPFPSTRAVRAVARTASQEMQE